MTTTETSLARIFAICDHVAESGETIRTEDEGREATRAFLGQNDKPMHAATQSPNSPSNAPGVACGDLVRRFRHSTYLDFTAPQECPRCQEKLEVKDHRAPWFSPQYTASKEWRYEVTCKACGWCDCNGYANRREVLAAIDYAEQIANLRGWFATEAVAA